MDIVFSVPFASREPIGCGACRRWKRYARSGYNSFTTATIYCAGAKRANTEWKGYKVHLTECCDPDRPLVITDVQTTSVATTDFAVLPVVQADLAERLLLPQGHLVDAGYRSAEHIVS